MAPAILRMDCANFRSFAGIAAPTELETPMFRYGKLARQAVSAISYLAEHYDPDGKYISSAEISRERKIPIALAAKLLSQMSGIGLTLGITGPGGGYRLAKDPSEIPLSDIVNMFEREDADYCPFGKGWCGSGKPCPLHNDFVKLEENSMHFLKETTLEVFTKQGQGQAQEEGCACGSEA